MSADAAVTDFDHPSYRKVTEAELAWLDRQFPKLAAVAPLETAIEYGCAVGVFTQALQRHNLKVLGLDLRPSNLSEARRRHPTAEFRIMDFDACSDEDFARLPIADLGFAFGVLYHLENPFGTLRRMCGRTRHAMLISTRTAEGETNALWFYRELQGAAHNVKSVTAVPTLSAVITGLYAAGFSFVYRPEDQPDHSQWAEEAGDGRRHSLIAFREPVEQPGWRRVTPGEVPTKWRTKKKGAGPQATLVGPAGQEAGADIVRAIGGRQLIITAGMARAGSTLLYNVARLCLEGAGKKVLAAWVDDFRPAGVRQADCVLIKVHAKDTTLRRRANCILTCHRDLRDVARSIRDMGWASSYEEAAGRLMLHVRRQAYWADGAALDLKYETMTADLVGAVRSVSNALGLKLDDARLVRVAGAIVDLKEPATNLDSVTLLHARHRISGRAGTWRGVLPTELVATIEAEHGGWLAAHGYDLASK